LPKHAQVVSLPQIERLPGAQVRRWTVSFGAQGLEGQEIRIHGLEATMIDVLVRLSFADGRVVSKLLRPDSPAFTVEASGGSTAKQYLRLGVEHILLGIDHLLFVLGLLLIVRGAGRLVKTITAFTIAHSITLALATLGVVTVPGPPVEAIIALSIVFVAREVVMRKEDAPGLTERKPWLVAFTFGLLHGFGFAGALREVGLPPNEIPAALLFFNIGVELGQLLFVAAVCLVIHYARRFGQAFSLRPPQWSRQLAPYAIGAVAAFWVIERIAGF
jgi:hydrogenase/urease accessory protein HupE